MKITPGTRQLVETVVLAALMAALTIVTLVTFVYWTGVHLELR